MATPRPALPGGGFRPVGGATPIRIGPIAGGRLTATPIRPPSLTQRAMPGPGVMGLAGRIAQARGPGYR